MSTKGTKHFPKFYLHFTNKYQQCAFNETSNHSKSPTVSLGIQKMAMFAQTQEPLLMTTCQPVCTPLELIEEK
jgi:hypothetical protein